MAAIIPDDACGPRVVAVARSAAHHFSKTVKGEISIIAGWGVAGDAHEGKLVQHRSRVAVDPGQLNLRQVHLIHAELFDELISQGFTISAGDLGENITTRGVDLLGLSRNALLRIGPDVVLEVTGLRNPCAQIERFRSGLLKAVLDPDASGRLVRRTGVMTIARMGGNVRADDQSVLRRHPVRMFR